MSSIEKAIDKLKKAGATADGVSDADRMRTQTTPNEPLQESIAEQKPSQKLSDHDGENTKTIKKKVYIDFAQLRSKGYSLPTQSDRDVLEQYRSIKRHLLANAFGKSGQIVPMGNRVMVTSSLPGEGKTYTAVNLALSMAMEFDTTVLLVDGDVLKSSLTNLLGLEGHSGILDILDPDSNVDIRETILSTNIERLKLLPSGQNKQNTTELLSSERMSFVIAELANRYPDRIIMFDAPPILATTEAKVTMDNMGQILMVVEAGRTPQQALKQALSELNSDKAIGIILNKTRKSFVNHYYGDYYGATESIKD